TGRLVTVGKRSNKVNFTGRQPSLYPSSNRQFAGAHQSYARPCCAMNRERSRKMDVDADARLKKTAEVRTEVVKAPRRGRRVMVLMTGALAAAVSLGGGRGVQRRCWMREIPLNSPLHFIAIACVQFPIVSSRGSL